MLIHGFTSTPKEMRWMGEYLNGQGYTVLGMRLAGHATRPEDLIRSRWQDWLLSVEDGYSLLRACTEQIFLVGLSLGSLLGLLFASQFPAAADECGRIGGVIAMSTPYSRPKGWRLKFTKALSRLKPSIPKGDGKPGSGWFGEAWNQHVAYPQYPVRSLWEMDQLMDRMPAALPQVKMPVLLITTRDDHPLICESMEKIHVQLGSSDKQMLWVQNSGHTLTEEPQRQFVFEASDRFIRRLARLQEA